MKGSDVDLFILTNEKKRVRSKISAYQNRLGKRIVELTVLKMEERKLNIKSLLENYEFISWRGLLQGF